ncbi:hypothetical protein FHX57_002008 [Paraburkholderia tropica]|uniref:hypothetical protein n=1 Tax=Paraburkholderia tropica TaxID=92647 RepID=UPI001615C2C6|nr:hypothetical protein [Paraburkholderia tropica]MBB2999677.1 hypothetical protein [Paraburkholderia tropica]
MAKADSRLGNIDRLVRAQNLAAQLEGLLSVTTGEAGEGFRVLSDLHQGNFMWACLDMAGELVGILSEIEVHRG